MDNDDNNQQNFSDAYQDSMYIFWKINHVNNTVQLEDSSNRRI